MPQKTTTTLNANAKRQQPKKQATQPSAFSEANDGGFDVARKPTLPHRREQAVKAPENPAPTVVPHSHIRLFQ